MINYLQEKVKGEFKNKEKKFGKDLWIEIIKMLYLGAIDRFWMDHLTAIEDLREGINLRGYAQLDPLIEYKNEAYSMFEQLMGNINLEVVRRLFRVEVEMKPSFAKATEGKQESLVYKSASAVDPFSQSQKQNNQSSNSNNQTMSNHQIPMTKHKLGRNDPCWCGKLKADGKPVKYKHCHYPN